MLRPISFAFAASLLPIQANAEVKATQHVEQEIVIIDDNGSEQIKRITADKVKPGEQVIYSLRYENDGGEPAESVVLVMPIPDEVTYVEGSVSGDNANVTFSADDGETYVARGRLTVTEGGAVRPATNVEITHIRWTLANAVSPADKGEVSFRGLLK